jgi:hypothetical protein
MQGVQARKEWRSFNVAEEGAHPALIIEITSPETADQDRVIKQRQYAQVGVEQYVIVDAVTGTQLAPPRLLGYALGTSGYDEQAPDERGRLWLAAARVWLGVDGGEIVCYDERGHSLGDYQAVVAELAAREHQVEREATARAAAEQRAAEAARQAADAQQQARIEAEARAALAERLRAVEDELRRLRER